MYLCVILSTWTFTSNPYPTSYSFSRNPFVECFIIRKERRTTENILILNLSIKHNTTSTNG